MQKIAVDVKALKRRKEVSLELEDYERNRRMFDYDPELFLEDWRKKDGKDVLHKEQEDKEDNSNV